jgi:CelD/BcsL family acetyltransferase involved in cellulose biosynthesis
MSANVFSSPAYLACVADAFYPGRAYEVADFGVEGRTYRLLRVESGRWPLPPEVVPKAPFMDFLEPTDSAKSTARRSLRYLPKVSLGRVTSAEWHAKPAAEKAGLLSSPLIDFTLFPTWDAFVQFSRATAHPGFRSQRARQQKKLHEKHGLVFRWHDDDRAALETITRWKSAQYEESGFIDLFQSGALLKHFQLLLERGQLTLTTMRLGGTLVAGHAGMVHEGRFYYWLPAYDKDWVKEGIGSMLTEWMIRESYERKLTEFDFLIGNEAYKWGYATHTRMIGPLGDEPLTLRVWRPVRARLMEEVRKHDHVYKELQALKRRVEQFRLR